MLFTNFAAYSKSIAFDKTTIALLQFVTMHDAMPLMIAFS
jgi:hypothetical protein